MILTTFTFIHFCIIQKWMNVKDVSIIHNWKEILIQTWMNVIAVSIIHNWKEIINTFHVTIHKASCSLTDPRRTIYYRPVSHGGCTCRLLYDGQEDLLFNINNNHLFQYGFLLQYLHFMVEGRNPLSAFLRACERSFATQSSTNPVKIKLLCEAWNAFSRLMDIDWQQSFVCSSKIRSLIPSCTRTFLEYGWGRD